MYDSDFDHLGESFLAIDVDSPFAVWLKGTSVRAQVTVPNELWEFAFGVNDEKRAFHLRCLLKGMSVEQLRADGLKKQPCAFRSKTTSDSAARARWIRQALSRRR